GQANKEESHNETINPSKPPNCDGLVIDHANKEEFYMEAINPLKPTDCDDLVSDHANKEEFHNEATNPSKLPDCDDLVSDHANEEFHSEATNPSISPDCETIYDSISGQPNKEFHNDRLKPPSYETIYKPDIKYSELTDLRPFESGGFGVVYKGQWNGLCVAAKFVKRGGSSTELNNKDFNRELDALRKSKDCKEHIIQFYGLSQAKSSKFVYLRLGLTYRLKIALYPESRNYILVMQFAENGTLNDYLKEQKEQLSLKRKLYLNQAILKGLKFLHDLNIVHRDLLIEKDPGRSCTEEDILLYTEKDIPLTESPLQCSTILSNNTTQMQLPLISKDMFLSFFERVHHLKRTWVPVNMQLNKTMCRKLGQCIIDAEHITCSLENQFDINADDPFITLENYLSFKAFLRNLQSIKNFIENISQIGGLKSFIRVTDSKISLNQLKNWYIKLLKEFSESMSSLNFECRIDKQVLDINKEIDYDIEETIKFIEALQHNFDEVDSIFEFIDQINANIKNVSINDDLFYNQSMGSIMEFKDRGIQKANDGSIIIIRQFEFHQDEKNDIFVQVALLKALKDLVNIAKFYGIIQDTSSLNSRYVITEWSDHGSLREYYVKHKPLDLLTKLIFAFDICNGLVFLNAVNFLHRDIRPENILISGARNLKAKITNFFHGRLMTDETKNVGVGPGIRYIAPEILKRNTRTHTRSSHPTDIHEKHKIKYDFNCETYSFGVVLWELANEKIPFDNYDVHFIKNKINHKNHQWNFDNSIPKEYIEISKKALNYTPSDRPTICNILKVLYNLVNDARKIPKVIVSNYN
ncbi:13952_t:CDS:10, partial [Dentiscutata heterogama]